jgi:transposase
MQRALEIDTLEKLAPKEHLLRTIDRFIEFEFIRDATAALYCKNTSCPAIDLVLPFKMSFIGNVFGIRSERPFGKTVQVTVAWRWLRMVHP